MSVSSFVFFWLSTFFYCFLFSMVFWSTVFFNEESAGGLGPVLDSRRRRRMAGGRFGSGSKRENPTGTKGFARFFLLAIGGFWVLLYRYF